MQNVRKLPTADRGKIKTVGKVKTTDYGKMKTAAVAIFRHAILQVSLRVTSDHQFDFSQSATFLYMIT